MSVIFIKSSSIDPIAETAKRLEPKLRSAFLSSVAKLQNSYSLEELLNAIKEGDVNKALSLLAIDKRFTDILSDESDIDSFSNALTEAFKAGAVTAAKELPSTMTVGLSFSMKNPEVISFLRQYTFPLIQQISSTTKEAVRDVITRAFQQGGHPNDQAREIKRFIGLTQNQIRAVSNYERSLGNVRTMSQALQRELRDGRFDGTVQRAIRQGSTLSSDQIDRMVARYREKYLKYRAEAIARTESLRASNKGQRSLWKVARRKGLLKSTVKRKWIVSADAATCGECADLDGTVVGLDEEFDDGIMDPPDPHPDCRCGVALVF